MLPGFLAPGGDLAMKVFQGEAYFKLLARTATAFAKAQGFKPKVSRNASREMHIACHGCRDCAGD